MCSICAGIRVVMCMLCIFFFFFFFFVCFFFQAEDGIRYLVRSRGLGDVYKRQFQYSSTYSGLFSSIGAGSFARLSLNEGIGASVYCFFEK